MEDPRSGTGKPERLKYFEREVYSGRLKEVDISSCRGHYG